MRNIFLLLGLIPILYASSCKKPQEPRPDPCLSPRPNVVTLNLPDSGAMGVHIFPTFEWCAYPNAVRYRIQISDDINFQYSRGDYDTLVSTNIFTPINQSVADTCFWRVKAYWGVDSTDWSSTYLFYRENDLRKFVSGEFNVKKYRRWTYIDRMTGIYCQNFVDGCLTYLGDSRIRVESEGEHTVRVTELALGNPTDTYDYYGGSSFKRNVGFAVEQFVRYWDNRGILLDSFEIEFETFGTSSGFYSGYLFKGPNPLKR